jgi:hydroxymethylpyrimidine pyrophosphatase-like HAD family hydrolase
VNGWFGTYNKSRMIETFCQKILHQNPATVLKHALFFGDSPNDEPSFKLFPKSVGVANIQKFATEMTVLPSFITRQEGGQGFAEALGVILQKRRSWS